MGLLLTLRLPWQQVDREREMRSSESGGLSPGEAPRNVCIGGLKNLRQP